MSNKLTQKERLEALFTTFVFGKAYIEEGTTTRVVDGKIETEVNKLDVSWSCLGRATRFYNTVLPALDNAGFVVQELVLSDADGETSCSFTIAKEEK